MGGIRYLLHGLLAVGLAIGAGGGAMAAPGDTLYSEDFDTGAGCTSPVPWAASNTTFSAISTQTSNSGNCSLFTRAGAVTTTSPVIDLSGIGGATLTAWLRNGADAFSEDPDTNENFSFEYLNSSSNWVLIEQSFGTDPNGQIKNVSLVLPPLALHSGFRLRVSQTTGSGLDFDYYHIDDILIVETTAPPPPPATGFGIDRCETFESGFGNWSTTNGTRSAINGDTFNSSSNSLFLRHNTVTTTSDTFDSDGLDEITVWVRRGSDTFSENPEANENLVFEYRNSSGTWIALETFPGSGTQGQIFERTYTGLSNAEYATFQVRFRLTSGSGSDFDYWHIDDLCFLSAPPELDVAKTVEIEQDPINGTVDPLGIPGAWAIYEITVTNVGSGDTDVGSMVIGDTIGTETTLFTGDFDGSGSPFEFVDGTGATVSGLSLDFGGLGDGTDGVVFRNGAGVSIIPSGGFDPAVASFELTFDGGMNGSSGGGDPTFTIRYRVLVD